MRFYSDRNISDPCWQCSCIIHTSQTDNIARVSRNISKYKYNARHFVWGNIYFVCSECLVIVPQTISFIDTHLIILLI